MQVLLFFIALSVLATVLPVLRGVWLWQLKEWRIDRLRAHLQAEGVVTSIYGRALPLVAIACTVLAFFLDAGIWIALPILLVWTLIPLVRGTQKFPVFTMKTLMIALASIVLIGGIAAALVISGLRWTLPLLGILYPIAITASWLIFLPIDITLKRRIMRAAKALREKLSKETIVIGVAGSVGKTTTKQFLHTLLEDFDPLTTPEHVNTELGVAGWLIRHLGAGETPQIILIEMGAYRRGEIATLCDFAKPTIGVLTRLGSDHLALFGSEEAIRKANVELLAALPKSGNAFILANTKQEVALKDFAACDTTLVGNEGEVQATKEKPTEDGWTFTVHNTPMTIHSSGKHNIDNALLAIAVASHIGVKKNRMSELLATWQSTKNTFATKKTDDYTLLDDTYNISPLSFRAALAWAAEQPERPRVLITAGLIETGAQSDTFHATLGSQAASCIERVIFLSPQAASAFAKGYGKKVELYSSTSARIPKNALLIALGRMPEHVISSLLP